LTNFKLHKNKKRVEHGRLVSPKLKCDLPDAVENVNEDKKECNKQGHSARNHLWLDEK